MIPAYPAKSLAHQEAQRRKADGETDVVIYEIFVPSRPPRSKGSVEYRRLAKLAEDLKVKHGAQYEREWELNIFASRTGFLSVVFS